MARAIDPRDGSGGPAIRPPSPLPDGRAVLLRRQAEEQLRAIWATYPESAPKDSSALLEELRVHQIELEMQNEELRRAQDSLEAARARYFDLYDLAPVGYLTLAPQGPIREVNLAAATLLGGPRSAVLGRSLSRFVHPEDQDTLYLCRQRLFGTGEPQRCELRLRRLDGDSVWVSLDANLGPDTEDGEPCWRLTLGDIGERKQAEETRVEEARCKDRFIATLGHELRNPLAPIRSVADILRHTPTLDSEHIRRLAEILSRQVAHVTRLVDDVLDVARIRHGTIPVTRQPFDLRLAAESAAEQARPLLDQRAQRLDLALPDCPAIVDGDQMRLAQAIVNLLRNASQFSPPGSPISLTLGFGDGLAAVRVEDRGIGIAPWLLPRLFAPFVQAEQTPERPSGGLGLGLSLVKGLMDLHGGSVEAQSPGPGRGSTFVLRLPMARTPVAQAPAAPVGASRRTRSILLVEDHPDVAEACARLLRVMGQRVQTVPNGPAALEAMERLQPDLILLDLGLPDMDGFEVASRLRATESGRAARLVALTGYGDPSDRARTQAAGFDEHLVKPLGRDELLDALSRCP